MRKSEIALLTVAVFGTLTVWLGGLYPSIERPLYDAQSIACSVPAAVSRGIGPSFGQEQVLFDQVSRTLRPMP